MLPFAAPALMNAGLTTPARALYSLYSVQCHQLPQRSYFLFGPQITYNLDEILLALGNAHPTLGQLRQFNGNESMGYKVAWSDRMVSLYGSFFLGGVTFAFARRRARGVSFKVLALCLLPLAIDGITHTISDFAGIGNGFRDSNLWLSAVTAGTLPASFYSGDAWGSFNSLMRLLTGVLAGVALAWVVFPRIDSLFGLKDSIKPESTKMVYLSQP